MTISRRRLIAGAPLAAALATPALASGKVEWTMVTSWPKKLPGPGMSAERIAQRVAAMSDGRFSIKVYAAGEIVPAFEVLDAVSKGVATCGHSASFFWAGKMPAANFFTTVPFGLTPGEHVAWIEAGGGQALWDELYAPFGVKPFMGGNTGVSMGGWFRKPIESLADLRGLKLRMAGLGAEIFRKLGATTVSLPPGEIHTALQSGVIDGAEFVGPGSDAALGLWRAAPYYMAPGFNKPNGTGEFIVNAKAHAALDDELKAILAHAAAAEAAFALAEMERLNAEALASLTLEHGVKVLEFPAPLIEAARAEARAVISSVAESSPQARRIAQNYEAFRDRVGMWSKLSLKAVLAARG